VLSWFRPKGKLILALIQAGWIDQDPVSRLIVHDWHDHADDSVRKRLTRHGLPFLSFTSNVTGQSPGTKSDGVSRPDPIHSYPSPEPSQSQSQMDTRPLRQNSAKAGETLSLSVPSNEEDSDSDEELRQTLSLWRLTFPAGVQEVDLYRLKAELRHVPAKAFCAHLDAMKKTFQPGGSQEPTRVGFFISTARNFAKEYRQAAGNGLCNAKFDEMTTAIELPGAGKALT